jgi:hypothetical protein
VRFGYEVADASANTAKTLNMVFRRAGPSTSVGAGRSRALAPRPGSGQAEDRPYERAVDKLVSGLDLDARHVGRRRLWWSRRGDIAGQVWVGPPASFGRQNWNRFVARGEVHHPRSVLVSTLGPARFRGSVGLFFK